jgi:hypothetical protein
MAEWVILLPLLAPFCDCGSVQRALIRPFSEIGHAGQTLKMIVRGNRFDIRVQYYPGCQGSPVAGQAAAVSGRSTFVGTIGDRRFLPGAALVQSPKGTLLWAMSAPDSSRRPGAA